MRWSLLVLLAAGCPRRDALPTSPPPPTVAGPQGATVDGGMRHTERLATVSWRADGKFQACGSGSAVAQSCLVVNRAGELPLAIPNPRTDGFVVDRSPFDRAPGGCRVRFDDARGDPGAPPARATLVGSRGPAPLAEWRPDIKLDGDYFAIETSFSPDGRWLAIVNVGVGLGVDERVVDVNDVQVRPAPACR